MKLFFTNISTAGIIANLADGEDAYIAKGVHIGSTDSFAIKGYQSGHVVKVYGTIASEVGLDIGDQATDLKNVVNVFEGGSIITTSDINSAGVRMLGGGSIINNHGTIDSFNGVIVGSTGAGIGSEVNNWGTITGTDAYGAICRYLGSNDLLTTKNYGVINGPVSYSGTYSNAVDIIYNKGAMNGSVWLGDGDDTYDGRNGFVKGEIHGAQGADKLLGGKEANKIFGEEGADVLQGCLGGDKLTGGSDADVFLYKSISESTSAARDQILDFSSFENDLINLEAIDVNKHAKGDQDFHFIGSKSFTRDAGELRYAQSNGNTYIQGDIDGDKKIDFSIKLLGIHNLTSSDFDL